MEQGLLAFQKKQGDGVAQPLPRRSAEEQAPLIVPQPISRLTERRRRLAAIAEATLPKYPRVGCVLIFSRRSPTLARGRKRALRCLLPTKGLWHAANVPAVNVSPSNSKVPRRQPPSAPAHQNQVSLHIVQSCFAVFRVRTLPLQSTDACLTRPQASVLVFEIPCRPAVRSRWYVRPIEVLAPVRTGGSHSRRSILAC
jgi:hypothetical protein